MTYGQKSSKLSSGPVYCSRLLYGILSQNVIFTEFAECDDVTHRGIPGEMFREQLDPTEKVVFQAIQMALIAVLSEVQQQQQKLFIKFWAKSPC